jgi:hypothetical protein
MEIDDIVFTTVFYILFALAIGALLYIMFWNPKNRHK